MRKRFSECIALIGAFLILILALSKGTFVILYPSSFLTPNPLFQPTPELVVVIISVIFELFVAVQTICFRKSHPMISGVWLMMFSVVVGVYRFGLWLYSPKSSCHCFGIIGMLFGSGNNIENILAIPLLFSIGLMALLLITIGFCSSRTKTICVIVYLTYSIHALSADKISNNATIISGIVTFNWWDRSGKMADSNDVFYFKVYRADEKWVILVTYQSGLSNLTSCDGKTIYYLNMPDNIPIDGGYIFPSNIPWPNMFHSIPWWIYILTKDYRTTVFGTNISHQNLPVPYQPPNMPDAFLYKAEITWSKDKPYFIDNTLFYYDKDRVHNCMNFPFRSYAIEKYISEDYINEIDKLINQYTNRFIGGKCAILSWTNTEYGYFPYTWEVIKYDSIYEQIYTFDNQNKKWIKGPSHSNPKIVGRYYGITTNICEGIFPGVPPELRRKTTISDHRYRNLKKHVSHILYPQLTYWPTNILNNIEGNTNIIVIKTATYKPESIYRYIILSIIFCSITTSFFLWRFGRKIKQKSETGGRHI